MTERLPVENRISRKLVGQIAAELTKLADGQSKPIQLPPERKLSEKFSVSRRAIRMAIDLLVKRGLLVRKQGSGNSLLPKGLSVTSVYLVVPSAIKPDDYFYSAIISRFALYAREHEIQLLPIRMDSTMVLNKEMPGIVIGNLSAEQFEEVTSRLKTVVSLAELDKDRCCQIFYDDMAIGREAARQLVIRGHRRVMMLAGPIRLDCVRKRLTGFSEAGKELGLEITVREGSMNWRGGYDQMIGYLKKVDRRAAASAVFAVNDWMAAGAMQAMVQAGVRVPEDMAIIGCGDVPLAAELEPGLSTFRLDVSRWVGQTFAALEQIWRLELPGKIILPAKFMERNSTGKIKEGRESKKGKQFDGFNEEWEPIQEVWEPIREVW